MPELELLRAGHAAAVLAFETANRAYFAATISDRGDEFFEHFAEQHLGRLAEQDAGTAAYYALVADDDSVLGRFNLTFDAGGVAELGYRMAEHAAGRGVATATVRELCSMAAARHPVKRLRAATSAGNEASQRVLFKAGFEPVGPADPADVGGKQGTWWERDVAGVSHVRRMDHVGITVEDLDAVTAFLVGLGLEVEGRTFVEGAFLDTVIGIPDACTEIVMLRPPEGGTGIELSRFVRPDHEPGSPHAMATELGLRNVCFEITELQETVDRLADDGYRLIGGIGQHEDVWRMAYVRGPEGIIVSLAERIG